MLEDGLGPSALVLRQVVAREFSEPEPPRHLLVLIATAGTAGLMDRTALCLPALVGLVAAAEDGPRDGAVMLVLAPTPDLAAQIYERIQTVSSFQMGLKIVMACGGLSRDHNKIYERIQTVSSFRWGLKIVLACGGLSTDHNKQYRVKSHSRRKLATHNHFSISGAKMWLLIFVLFLLFAKVESVSPLGFGQNNTNFCPAPHLQFKRPMPFVHGWTSEASQLLLKQMEHEWKITEIQVTNCQALSFYKQAILASGAFLAVMANLGPMVPARRMEEVSPDRRRILFLCSLTLLASNLSWVIYFGSDDCKSLFGYLALLLGCGSHGFFAWFFRQQQCNKWKCLSSIIVALGLSVLVGLVATNHSLRLGPKTIFGTNIISAIASIFGVILNATSIRLRAISGSGRFAWFPFVIALSGAAAALISTLSQDWSKDKLLDQLTFKIGISILFLGRSDESFQLWSYRHQLVADSIEDGVRTPLLSYASQDDTTTVAEDGGPVRADEEEAVTDNYDNVLTGGQKLPTAGIDDDGAAETNGKEVTKTSSTDVIANQDDNKKTNGGNKGDGDPVAVKMNGHDTPDVTSPVYKADMLEKMQDLKGVLSTSDLGEDNP